MYTVGGRTFPVVDAQVHVWDASPHNQAAPAGESYAIDVLRRHRVDDSLQATRAAMAEGIVAGGGAAL